MKVRVPREVEVPDDVALQVIRDAVEVLCAFPDPEVAKAARVLKQRFDVPSAVVLARSEAES